MTDQRAVLDAAEWSIKFGRPWHRLTKQILPAFAPQAVEAARARIVEQRRRSPPVEATAR